MTINDNCEAFDWAWALWYWCSHWHGGMSCPKYAGMCSIPVTNVPDIDFDDNDCDEYEMAVMFYHELDEDNWEEYLEIFTNYMETEWDKEAC